MSRLKELWIAEFERLRGEAEDKGHPNPEAFAEAHVHEAFVDRYTSIADMADQAKDEAKGRGEWPPKTK